MTDPLETGAVLEPPEGPSEAAMFPAMATFPAPGIFDPADGKEKTHGKRKPLKAGDGVAVLSVSEDAVVMDSYGYVWRLPVTSLRVHVSTPWLKTMILAANGFARALKQLDGPPKPEILVPNGPLDPAALEAIRTGEPRR